jgi:hypothetical protein
MKPLRSDIFSPTLEPMPYDHRNSHPNLRREHQFRSCWILLMSVRSFVPMGTPRALPWLLITKRQTSSRRFEIRRNLGPKDSDEEKRLFGFPARNRPVGQLDRISFSMRIVPQKDWPRCNSAACCLYLNPKPADPSKWSSFAKEFSRTNE